MIRRHRAFRRPSLGYTVVELLMALAIFAIGVTGIIAMQKITVQSNTNARNVAIANRIAQGWLDALVADAALWNHPSEVQATSDLTDTTWLDLADNTTLNYQLPAYSTTGGLGPSFDALGNPIVDPTSTATRFCVHLRLRRLDPAILNGNPNPDGRIAATVRVFWRRDGSTRSGALCSETDATVSAAAGLADFHYVFHTTLISQQTAQRK